MSEVFQRLISNNNLPRYLLKDPQPVQAMTLLYAGTAAVVTIDRHHLTTSVRGGSGANLDIDLQSYATISLLVTYINTQTGYTATAIAGGAPALSLMEVQNLSIITTALTLSAFTSLLWQIMYPIAWAIEDSTINQHGGLDETAIESGDDGWLDKWGNTYGFILRLPGESDAQYGPRIMKEVVRLRLSIAGIAIALMDAGVGSPLTSVTDGHHDAVWVMGDPLGKILIDRIHCWDVIWVQW